MSKLKKITESTKEQIWRFTKCRTSNRQNLIGGFSIKCGDEVTDYSIKGKLEKLRNQIK